MAKPGDLIGKSGGSGFGPIKANNPFQPSKQQSEEADHSATKKKPDKNLKPGKGSQGGGGGTAPTSVRPKV
jgi:hypothetical protein